ncbi:hypothetical protein QQF64_026467 [Cirrhinus molitorella]|uniref:Uncharacterized protein n=1 Tax=Cirrhinus molitorella TaxID=172907 RepID=A0ABR3NA52_9TELE
MDAACHSAGETELFLPSRAEIKPEAVEGGKSPVSTCGSGINKSVISADIGLSNSAGRLGPLPWVLTASLILRDPGQAMENKSLFDKTQEPCLT